MDPAYSIYLEKMFIWIIPIIFAITIHEVAHGWVANKFGDPTARLQGRITINPIKHIDLIGTIIVPLIFLAISPFVFGWAKPVPVNYRNLKNPRRDMALVAFAGPFSNFLMALLWAGLIKLDLNHWLSLMAEAGLLINLILAWLNLIPIPPLDGSRIITSFLPNQLQIWYNHIEKIGFFILIALIISGVLGQFLMPVLSFSLDNIFKLYGINQGIL